MSGTQETFDEAIKAHVLAFDGVRALVGERVYFDIAPTDAATPYIIISWQSWNEVIDRTRAPEVDATANLRGVVDVNKQGARLGIQIADQLEACVRAKKLAIGHGWGVHWSRVRSRFRNVPVIDRKDYVTAGVLVQIGAIQG